MNRRHGLAPLQSANSSPKTSQRGNFKESPSPERESEEDFEEEALEEDFYGDEGYESEELDLEGYEINE